MFFENTFPFITDGIVKDTDDPQQNGRIKIWCPALDGEDFNIDTIPWAEYASPFGGVTQDFNAGRNKTKSQGPVSYGFWALPKVGAQVLVFLLNGDPNRRFYFASVFGLHRNRSLPAGRNKSENNSAGPFTDSYDPLQPAYDNLRTAFQNQMSSSQAQTRGGFERQAAQDRTAKDGKDGYAKNPVDGKYLDPQTYCFVTPGHHTFLMDDSADNCRIRLKTCEGNQVILDDTNERIYISTAKGKTWVELDEDGHIHVFGSKSISLRAGSDINMLADGNINLEAGNHVNIKAVSGGIKASAKQAIHIRSSTGSIYQTACDEYHICSTNGYFLNASEINNKADGSIMTTADGGGIHVKSAWEIVQEAGSTFSVNAGGNIDVKSSQGAGVTFGGDTDMTTQAFKVKANSIEMDGGSSFTFGGNVVNTLSSGGSGGSYSSFGTAIPSNPPIATTSNESVCAENADGPSVVPGHEPWKRPSSAKSRNKYWRE